MAKKVWGKFNIVEEIKKDPKRAGMIGVGAVPSTLVSLGMDAVLKKGWKVRAPKIPFTGTGNVGFKLPSWKPPKLPAWKAPAMPKWRPPAMPAWKPPAMPKFSLPSWKPGDLWKQMTKSATETFTREHTLIPKIAGSPIADLKRSVIAGAVGAAVSPLWIVPAWKFSGAKTAKYLAIGAGISCIGWVVKGAIHAVIGQQKGVFKKVKQEMKGPKTFGTFRANVLDVPAERGAYIPYVPSHPMWQYKQHEMDVSPELYAQPEDGDGFQQDYYNEALTVNG